MVMEAARSRINLPNERKKQLLKKKRERETERNVGLLKNVCVFPE